MEKINWRPTTCNCKIAILNKGEEFIIETPCEEHTNLSVQEVLTDIRAKSAILKEQALQEEQLIEETLDEPVVE